MTLTNSVSTKPKPDPAIFADLRPGLVVIPNSQKDPEVVYKTDQKSYYRTNQGSRYEPFTLVPDAKPYEVFNKLADSDIERHLELSSSLMMGADPEIFAVDQTGTVIPAFTYLPDKKQAVRFYAPGFDHTIGTSFFDGFQAEWTIGAHQCLGFLTDYIRDGLQTVLDAARKVNPAARLVTDGVLEIPYEMRRSVSPDHLQLGCAPSMNAYGDSPMAVPSPEDLAIRFAGSHMHFSFGAYGVGTYDENKIIRLLDAILGVALVSFGEGLHDSRRRQFYGRCGEYRHHPDERRIEWRVPDVTLIAHPATLNLIWELARVVVRLGVAGMDFIWDSDPAEVREIVNNYDVTGARRLLTKNDKVLHALLLKSQRAQSSEWGAGPEWTDIGVQAFLHGISSVVRDPRDIHTNWWLDRATTGDIRSYNNQDEKAKATFDPTHWWREAYCRKHANWPAGRIWSSAAKFVEAGGLV